jgi:hypothetical protein
VATTTWSYRFLLLFKGMTYKAFHER